MASGGEFLTNIVNSFTWQLGGNGNSNFGVGGLLFQLTQPLLRGAFRHVRTEALTQAERLKTQKKNLAFHELKAPQDGTLTYARQQWRENGAKMHEGSVVDQNQIVVVLPDMNRMQVKVGVHETMVSKVKEGQPAIVRVDAFGDTPLAGKVKSVSDLSRSTRWEKSRVYDVIVTINSFPDDVKIKPGMTAEVEILVGTYENVLAVPIQAITNFGRKKFAFVEKLSGNFETQEVKTGHSNLSFVEIKSGLTVDHTVALDAYQRGLLEFEGVEPEEMEDPMPAATPEEVSVDASVEPEQVASSLEEAAVVEEPAVKAEPDASGAAETELELNPASNAESEGEAKDETETTVGI